MERQGFTVPLLVGGATTSKAHTAVKIAPGYSQPAVHVLDASRAVGVVSKLLNPELKSGFVEELEADYDKLRAAHAERKSPALLPLAEARRRGPRFDWATAELPQPEFSGIRVLSTDALTAAAEDSSGDRPLVSRFTFHLSDLVPFIDWSPFFHTWEMRGRYPEILKNPEAQDLFNDAQELLQKIIANNWLAARGVYGFFPANSVGDDVELYADGSRNRILATFHFLRQQMAKPQDQYNHCLADYVAPKTSTTTAVRHPLDDHIGAFAVSTGFGASQLCKKFEEDHDDYDSIMIKALADRLAEAFAEYLHKRARQEWGFGKHENLTNEDLIREKYRGIRPAAGYPACPDHTEKRTLWQLLDVERHTGIKLTENYAMWPGASVSGLYFAYPESKYFGVGKIDRDQVIDYQRRKGMDLQELERWLAPSLDYEPVRPAQAGLSRTPPPTEALAGP